MIKSVSGKKKITGNFDKILKKSKKESIDRIFLKSNIIEIIKSIKENDDPKLREFLTGYLFIRLVTYFQVTMEELATSYINSQKDFDLSTIFSGEWSIPISKIPTILNQELTNSAIVIASFNFQNLEETHKVYSKLFKLDFISTIKDLGQAADDEGIKERAKYLSDNWKVFENIFIMRHKIAHEVTQPKTRGLDYVEFLAKLMQSFIESTITLKLMIQGFHPGDLQNDQRITRFLHKKFKEYEKKKTN